MGLGANVLWMYVWNQFLFVFRANWRYYSSTKQNLLDHPGGFIAPNYWWMEHLITLEALLHPIIDGCNTSLPWRLFAPNYWWMQHLITLEALLHPIIDGWNTSSPWRLYCTQLLMDATPHHPGGFIAPNYWWMQHLTTRDRELVSVLEDASHALGSNPRPLSPRSVTQPTLPQAGRGSNKVVL